MLLGATLNYLFLSGKLDQSSNFTLRMGWMVIGFLEGRWITPDHSLHTIYMEFIVDSVNWLVEGLHFTQVGLRIVSGILKPTPTGSQSYTI